MFFRAVFILTVILSVAEAKVFVSLDEALKQIFPGCELKTENYYLSKEQLGEVQRLSEVEVRSALGVRYLGYCDKKLKGIAYTDSHRVRTNPETLLLVANPQGVTQRIAM